MKRFFYIILAIAAAAWGLCAHAQMPALRNFTTLDYGAGTQNWAVDLQDEQEVLFANNNGLLTFDSYQWRVTPVPNFTNVRSLLYDKRTKRIYVGATDEFGYFYGDENTCSLAYKSLSAAVTTGGKTFGEVWRIEVVGSEVVFQAKDRIFVADAHGKVKTVPVPHRIESAASVKGTLYVSCREAIYGYRAGRLSQLPGTDPLRGKEVRAVLPHKGQLIFVTASDGLYVYDGKLTREFNLDISDQLKAFQVYCAAIKGSCAAFGTVRGGLIVKNLETGEVDHINNVSGLSNSTVLSMKFDRLNNIWLGLDNGIAYVMLGMPCRDLLGVNNSIGTGYASLVSGNSLYLGTNQGLFALPYPLHKSMSAMRPTLVHNGTGQIWSLTELQGKVLCGSDAGAYVVNGLEAQRIEGLGGTWGFMPIKGHADCLLACDYNGFVVLQRSGDGYVVRNRVQGLNVASMGLATDTDGSYWMSHWQRGVYHFSLSPDLKRVAGLEYYNRGNGLPTDDNNLVCKVGRRVLVSSADGFRHYDRRARKLVKDEGMNRVFNTYGVALRVMPTPSGDLWAYKPGYLAMAHKTAAGSYQVRPFAYSNIIRRLQMSLGHIGSTDAAHTLMNHENGYYVIDNNFTNQSTTSHAQVRSITSTNEHDTVLYVAIPGVTRDKIKIPHKLNSLRLEFVMPEFREDRAVDYQYYLEHYDAQWSATTATNSKEYTHLPKGTYTFRLRATNRLTGITSETAMTIEVLPAWYETWWATLLWLLLGLALMVVAVKWLKRRADREVVRVNREKEQQLREQEAQFQIEEEKKEKELISLRNAHLEVELKHKSSQLADSTMNLVRKNDILQEIDQQMEQLAEAMTNERNKTTSAKLIRDIRRSIKRNIEDDDNWEKFEENFNLVYDNFMLKLTQQFPLLKLNDRKLCAYLRMELSSKEMAALLNTTVRSIETARYRLRKKLNLSQGENLTDFIKNFSQEAPNPDGNRQP